MIKSLTITPCFTFYHEARKVTGWGPERGPKGDPKRGPKGGSRREGLRFVYTGLLINPPLFCLLSDCVISIIYCGNHKENCK